MKRFAFVIALLAIAGVVFAQDAPVAEKSRPTPGRRPW